MSPLKRNIKRMIQCSLVVLCTVVNFPIAEGDNNSPNAIETVMDYLGIGGFIEDGVLETIEQQYEDTEETPIVLEESEYLCDETGCQTEEQFIEEEEKIFDSKRLIIATTNPLVFRENEPIISEYEGLYLLQYETYAKAKEAYDYYLSRCDFVEPDIEIKANSNSEEDLPFADSQMTSQENPLNELADELQKDTYSDELFTKRNIVVALLDSGAPQDGSVYKAVSMLSDDALDRYGHGTEMLSAIKAKNPDANVLSIKVLDDAGRGSISSVVAGIQYAIENNVDVINMSLSARISSQNSILREYVLRAVENGILVVASAGNGGYDTKWFTPANIDEAIVVTAFDNEGDPRPDANYGKTVDIGVIGAESTSYAAATVSGYISNLLEAGADYSTILSEIRKDFSNRDVQVFYTDIPEETEDEFITS